jgi:hypothetical protein
MVNSMTRDSYEHLRSKHQILSADSIDSLGLRGQAQLPNRKFREGVPDDVNDEGAHTATIIGVDTSGGKRG